jgi:hypothetical protein
LLCGKTHSCSLSKHFGYFPYTLFYRVLTMVYDTCIHRSLGLSTSYVQHWKITLCFGERFFQNNSTLHDGYLHCN